MNAMHTNYHTHTYRCHHAFGTEREYIEKAIDAGFTVLGFSDHTPQFYRTDYYNKNKMRPEELQGYVETILSLKEEYRGRIEIPLGLEVEYYPAIFDRLLTFLKDYPIEYFILGQHYIGSDEKIYSGAPTGDKKILFDYVAQVKEALSTGRFSCLAHPDLINYTGDAASYYSAMKDLCRTCRDLGIPVELNLHGLEGHRNYPNTLFFRIAAEEGLSVILGSDAHLPEEVYKEQVAREAMQMAKLCGCHVIDTLTLRPPL